MSLILRIIKALKPKPKSRPVETEAERRRREADEELITVILPTIDNDGK